ncbi:MAG: radical SAM protein [Candidatus Cloacimonadota bacterium]|nr:radical SAM protein [Candidatus Cloacimonadota bacterium]
MKIKHIFVTKSALNDQITHKILDFHSDCETQLLNNSKDINKIPKSFHPKQTLLLAQSKGDIVKGCPGTSSDYLCCRYQIINQTINCPLNCTYCILQFYLNQPATIIYTDFDNIFSELSAKLDKQKNRFIRIGTGELGDSLALYGSRLFAEKAIKYFADRTNVLFEIKSKITNIDKLIKIHHANHTVFSWSLNPTEIVKAEETNTASIEERLSAAKKAQEAGFLVGFHFDPIFAHPDWKKIYGNLIDKLYSIINPDRIVWISMGSLRFPPEMKEKINRHYPHTKIIYGEMLRGHDGKMRYARPVRVPIYKFIYKKLSEIANPPFIYFCMENKTVWQEVMGFSPKDNAELDWMFAESIFRRFDIINREPLIEDYEQVLNLDGKEF